MTRHERCQLLAIYTALRLDHIDGAIELLRQILSIAKTEHKTEDEANTALEQSKGADNDQRPIR